MRKFFSTELKELDLISILLMKNFDTFIKPRGDAIILTKKGSWNKVLKLNDQEFMDLVGITKDQFTTNNNQRPEFEFKKTSILKNVSKNLTSTIFAGINKR